MTAEHQIRTLSGAAGQTTRTITVLVNGDGLPDLVQTGFNSTDPIAVLFNDGIW